MMNYIRDMTWYKIAKGAQWVEIDSSFIEAAAYYPIVSLMDIKLKGGRQYTFIDVPKKTFDNFIKAESQGKFFNEIIKSRYKIRK